MKFYVFIMMINFIIFIISFKFFIYIELIIFFYKFNSFDILLEDVEFNSFLKIYNIKKLKE